MLKLKMIVLKLYKTGSGFKKWMLKLYKTTLRLYRTILSLKKSIWKHGMTVLNEE
jgi:hypothetical protein